MNPHPQTLTLSLPDWVEAVVNYDTAYPSDEDKARLAILLSDHNVREATGGPFGAAVFEADSHRLIAAGVNRVVTQHCSVAHAEMLALMLAQSKTGRHRLQAVAGDGAGYVLAASSQPCSMCTGALPWAGIQRLIYAADREDVESLAGFDEGPIPFDWEQALTGRGIVVRRHVLRDAACRVLKAFAERNGDLY